MSISSAGSLQVTRHRVVTPVMVLLFAAWALMVVARVLGPSDLYDKEQPRTVAYTADMLVNHYWVIPHDTFGIPATKPPLFNWVSLPFVAGFGYREWALKMPSVLASLAALLLIVMAGRRVEEQAGGERARGEMGLGFGAGLIWLATWMNFKLLYVARPDMLLTAFLAGAWLAGTIIVQSDKRKFGAVAGFWLCVVGAVLTKGTPAVLPLIYLPLAAWLMAPRGERLKRLARSGWWWGLPVVLLVAGWYLHAAHAQEPEFFRRVLMGSEVGGHIAKGKQWLTAFNGPLYVVARFLPWSILALVVVVKIPIRKWFLHPLGPAILWVLVVVVAFSVLNSKRPDRYAPVFPALAVIAAFGVYHLAKGMRYRLPRCATALAVCMIVGMVLLNQFGSEAAQTRYGEHVKAFAKTVSETTGGDVILFEDGELTPLETLLGRNQKTTMSDDQVRQAKWSIRFCTEGKGAVAISEKLDEVDPIASFAEYVKARGVRMEEIDGSKGVQAKDERGETAYTRLKREWEWYDMTIQGRLALFPLTPDDAVERYRRLEPGEDAAAPAKKGSVPARWLQHYHHHTMLLPEGAAR